MTTKNLSARDLLAYISIKNNGDWSKIRKELSDKKNDYDYDTVMDTIKGLNFITPVDKDYPDCLKQLSQPPIVLFYKGDISLIKNIDNNICVAGIRAPSLEAQYTAKNLLGDSIGKNIVIDGSKGLTEIMVNEQYKNKFICVLPCGLDSADKFVDNCDLIITEYPSSTPKSKDNCIARNRIMAAISSKILIIEAVKQSSVLTLVNLALYNGRDVLVVPTTFSKANDYCNNDLIYDGATIIVNKDMLLEQFA